MNRRFLQLELLWFATLFISVASSPSFVQAQDLPRLTGTFPPEGGPITISTIDGPVVARAVDFRTLRGHGTITAGGSAAPFKQVEETDYTSFVYKYDKEVDFRSPGEVVTLDGSITLDVIASADAKIDSLWWRSLGGTAESGEYFPTIGGDALRNSLVASYPYDGGPITIAPPAPNTSLPTNGLMFSSPQGRLVSGGKSAPFATLQQNTPLSWRASSLTEVNIDGPITLDLLVAEPDSPVTGELLSGTLGNGTFDVVRDPAPPTNLLKGTYSHQGPVEVSSTAGPVALRGLDFRAEIGQLVGGSDTAPFESLVHNNSDRWAVTSNTDIILDGSIRLDVRTNESRSRPNGVMTNGNGQSFSFPMERRDQLVGSASYPYDGGPVSIDSRTTDFVFRGHTNLTSVRIDDPGEMLVGGTDAGVFQTVSSNTPTQWQAESTTPVPFANFPSGIPLDVHVPVGTVAKATISDGLDELTLTIDRADPLPSGLIGSYPLGGGPVLLKTTNGPESLRSLEINAMPDHGKLIGTGNPGPFETVVTNEPTQWAAQSAANVVIDGTIQLDLQVEPSAFLNGRATDGSTTSEVIFNGFTADILDTDYAFYAYPEEGGNIWVISLDGAHLGGVDLKSNQPGVLQQGTDPSPFAFFITGAKEDQTQVTAGSLGSVPTIDGAVELDIFVTAGPASRLSATGASTGNVALVPVALPVVAMPYIEPPLTCIVPENGILGDLDGNGSVDFGDFLTLSANYQKQVSTYAEGDIDCDGDVLFDDFLWLGSNFGRTAEAALVPEPSFSLPLLLIFLLCVCTQFQRRSLRA